MRNVEKFPQCKIAGLQKEIYERSNNRKKEEEESERVQIKLQEPEVLDAAAPGFKCVTSYDVTLAHTHTGTHTHTDSHHFQSSILDPRCLIPIGFTVNYAQR